MSAIPRTASVPSEQNKKITGCRFFALHPVCFLLGVRLFLLRLLLCVFVFVVFLLEGEAELELFVAVVHKVLEYDRGGDYQRADDERRYVVKKKLQTAKRNIEMMTLSESGFTMIIRLNMAVMTAILRTMKLSGMSASRTP